MDFKGDASAQEKCEKCKTDIDSGFFLKNLIFFKKMKCSFPDDFMINFNWYCFLLNHFDVDNLVKWLLIWKAIISSCNRLKKHEKRSLTFLKNHNFHFPIRNHWSWVNIFSPEFVCFEVQTSRRGECLAPPRVGLKPTTGRPKLEKMLKLRFH